MNAGCPDPLELDLIQQLPADDPRRKHVKECSHCRGLLEAMELFLEPGSASDLDSFAATDAELARRLQRSRRSGARRPGSRRIGLAVAAVLALFAVGLTTNEFLKIQTPASVDPGQYQRGLVTPAEVSVTADAESIHLVWSDAPAANTLVYTFLSGDLRELGRRQSSGPLALSPQDPLTQAAFCQVLAVAQGDTIARSGISRLFLDQE